jgi:hypothetical protein
MSTSSQHDPLLDFIDDLLAEAELEEILSRPPGEVHAELVAAGADLERLKALVEHLVNGGPHPGPPKRKDVTS